jgi:hypothetical protein
LAHQVELVEKEDGMNGIISVENIRTMIFILRGKKVMFDRDLAMLYGVDTKQLVRQVRRNIERFPEDFMFQLTKAEVLNLRCQFGTSSWGGARYLSLVFTEHGVSMLASVLHSKQAIKVNIQIVRAFISLRRFILTNEDIKRKIKEMEKKYNGQFAMVFKALNQLLEPAPVKEKPPIGFRR